MLGVKDSSVLEVTSIQQDPTIQADNMKTASLLSVALGSFLQHVSALSDEAEDRTMLALSANTISRPSPMWCSKWADPVAPSL